MLDLPEAAGRVDLDAMLRTLAEREVNEVHVEAGARLNASLISTGLVDELLVYLAPRLVGPGRGMAALGPVPALSAAIGLRYVDVTPIGDDLRLRLRPPGREAF